RSRLRALPLSLRRRLPPVSDFLLQDMCRERCGLPCLGVLSRPFLPVGLSDLLRLLLHYLPGASGPQRPPLPLPHHHASGHSRCACVLRPDILAGVCLCVLDLRRSGPRELVQKLRQHGGLGGLPRDDAGGRRSALSPRQYVTLLSPHAV
ncbi:hypothetical protein Naga_102527g1, partial [Nannochloropsis gaditana]